MNKYRRAKDIIENDPFERDISQYISLSPRFPERLRDLIAEKNRRKYGRAGRINPNIIGRQLEI